MAKLPRYQDTGTGSFFGDFIYDQIIPRDHFLVALHELFDWEAQSERLIHLYKGCGLVGRPPYPPVLVFKMLSLSYLFNVSERQIAEMAQYHLVVKWFLGLAVTAPAPDHSSLTKFKARLLAHAQGKALEELFDDLLRQAQARGVQLGELQVVDSVHTQAKVNALKERERQGQGKPPRDPDAGVVRKGKRTVVDAEGQPKEEEITYRGFKSHVAVDAATDLVTTVIPTHGQVADNRAFRQVRAHDRELGIQPRAYTGDAAYDDTDIREQLAVEGISSHMRQKACRTRKKDANKQVWLLQRADPQYQQDIRQRFRVEQPFGEAKEWHGLERCRYLGLARYTIQALMTFLVLNCKRIVKLLTGITFRPLAKGPRGEPWAPVYASLPWA